MSTNVRSKADTLVFITSAYSDAEPISSFLQAAKESSRTRYRLTDDADEADLILFIENSRYHKDRYFRKLTNHPLVRNYPQKVFMYNPHDTPWLVLPGLYASMPKQRFDNKVIAACNYVEVINPYVRCDFDKQPTYLFSFCGTPYRGVRSRIAKLTHPRASINAFAANMYGHGRKNEPMMNYAELLVDSKFILCPKGIGTSSIRLFEVLKAGRVPVIISDNWVPPKGPDWHNIAVFVPEHATDQIPRLLEMEEHQWEQKARAARAAWEQYFSPDVVLNYMIEQILELQNLSSYKMPLALKLAHMKAKGFFRFRFFKQQVKVAAQSASRVLSQYGIRLTLLLTWLKLLFYAIVDELSCLHVFSLFPL